MLEAIEPCVTLAMATALLQPYSLKEVKASLFHMHLSKSSGLDGFCTLFFQKYWHVVGEFFMALTLCILETDTLDKSLNYTYLTLIPKSKKPIDFSRICLISLCIVLYKLVTKVYS